MRLARRLATLSSHLALLFFTVIGAAHLLITTTQLPDLSRYLARSQVVTGNRGEPIWGFLAPDDRWRLPASRNDVDPQYVALLTAYEDKRFYRHPGVDILALIRASYQAVLSRRAVSGGSTLTMQVVRLLEPQPRTFAAKIDQILKAIRLERSLSKDDILKLYLTLAPFGGNVDGVRAASLLFLGKDAKRLTPSEAATLVAIPQAPEARRLDRYPRAAAVARDRVVNVLLAAGAISLRTARLARQDTALDGGRSFSNTAPFFARLVRRMQPKAEVVPTMLDSDLERVAERIASEAVAKDGSDVNVAIVVVRNRDCSIAAYVGGARFGADLDGSYVDLVQRQRSPGSALKPFIYAVAFEKLLAHPDTIIADRPIEIDGYRPENADGEFMGDLTIRQALTRSRNTTAVKLLQKIGVDEMLGRFRQVGSPLSLPKAEPLGGLATALGGEGVTLGQLTSFYTALARDGHFCVPRAMTSEPLVEKGSLVSKFAARATADILADSPPPAGQERLTARNGGRRLGFKTGTSYGFRDAWAVGFDQLHTVGVWVGRPDGAAHLGGYGIVAAAPLMMNIFEYLPVPEIGIEPSVAELGSLAPNSNLPPQLLRFDNSQGDVSPISVLFPRNGAIVESGTLGDATVQLTLTVDGGKGPFVWEVNGKKTNTQTPALPWKFGDRGQFDLRVTDSVGETAVSSFWLN